MSQYDKLSELVKEGDYMFLAISGQFSSSIITGKVICANDAGVRYDGLKIDHRGDYEDIDDLLANGTEFSGVSERVAFLSPDMEFSKDPTTTGIIYLRALAILQDGYKKILRQGDDLDQTQDETETAMLARAKKVVSKLESAYKTIRRIHPINDPIDYKRLEIAQYLIKEIEN